MNIKQKSLKVTYNIWGNYCGFIGTERVHTSAQKFDAVDWASDKLETGEYTLSPKSHITMAEIQAHRAALA